MMRHPRPTGLRFTSALLLVVGACSSPKPQAAYGSPDAAGSAGAIGSDAGYGGAQSDGSATQASIDAPGTSILEAGAAHFSNDTSGDSEPEASMNGADAGPNGNGASAHGGSDSVTPIDPVAETMQTRADEALSALMLNFWPALRANTTTYDWMYAHYWDAVLDATERRGPNAFSGTARMFYELQNQRGWLDGFYDDEDWITLALLHAYKATGDATYLDQAKVVFADIMNAWDTTCCGSHPGGIWWEKPTIDKVTAVNAGAVISGSRLYEATQDESYLAFATKVYGYWSTYMVDATSGHVYDDIDNAGTINTAWSFTYNEGLFIGAIVELAQATGDTSNMPLAHKVAGYMMSQEIETTALGTILSDGQCSGDGEMFKGIGMRYLRELYAADTTHTEYRDFLQRSADAAWTLARDPSSGDISCDWAGPFDATTGVVGSLGSAAVGLAAAAEALGPGAARPALQYEAEEGDLHGVGFEATYAGFSGWGYLAGWNGDGQSVDLLVDVPATGRYELAFRYATVESATRSLSVNGQLIDPSLAFASTGAYTSYATVTPVVTLAEGKSTITIAFATAQASSGYLNLDRAQLTLQ
jgi:predicted alpha-1,6-mannanase (GH76 family)